jgi:hypothetical protein
VTVTKDKKEIILTKAALGIRHLVNQFANGNKDARRDLFKYAAELGIDLQAKTIIEEALGITSQAELDDYVRRRYAELSNEVAPDDHVKAPPDLIDDDVTKPASDETPATSPQPVKPAKKHAEPVLDKNGKPMLVSDSRYLQYFMKRALAQLKKDRGES